jgi:hypothetical protein
MSIETQVGRLFQVDLGTEEHLKTRFVMNVDLL